MNAPQSYRIAIASGVPSLAGMNELSTADRALLARLSRRANTLPLLAGAMLFVYGVASRERSPVVAALICLTAVGLIAWRVFATPPLLRLVTSGSVTRVRVEPIAMTDSTYLHVTAGDKKALTFYVAEKQDCARLVEVLRKQLPHASFD